MDHPTAQRLRVIQVPQRHTEDFFFILEFPSFSLLNDFILCRHDDLGLSQLLNDFLLRPFLRTRLISQEGCIILQSVGDQGFYITTSQGQRVFKLVQERLGFFFLLLWESRKEEKGVLSICLFLFL